jgi:hypothetical protein
MKKLLVAILVTLLMVELSSRLYFQITRSVPLLKMDHLIYNYYPELRQVVDQYDRDSADINILILGGSVIAPDLYCDPSAYLQQRLCQQLEGKSVRIYNVARIGHSSLDSRIKTEVLSQFSFDYTVFYHGINDSRANNIPSEYFDLDYKHFSYYEEVLLLLRHSEIKWTVIPYTFDLLRRSFRNQAYPSPKVPPFYLVTKDSVPNKLYWEFGGEIKTIQSFAKNIESIHKSVTREGKGMLVLMTYAYYLPANYSLQAFLEKQLDYDEQKWPVEIYGQPENVVKAIQAHNNVIQSFSKHDNLLLLDFQPKVPQNGLYFHDICHLTEKGCALVNEEIERAIMHHQKKKVDD